MRLAPIAAALAWLVLTFATPASATAGANTTVAVLYFDYDGTSDQMAFLRKGLNQMLVTDLVDTPGVTVVERVRLEAVLAELELSRSRKIDRASAVRVGKLLGARYLILGAYFDFKDTLHISIKMVDVETGAVVAAVRDRRPVDDFWALEQHLAAELAEAMKDKIATRATKRARRAHKRRARPRPANKPGKLRARTAARYGRALDAMDRGDTRRARAELEAVVATAPDFEMAAVDLASLAK